MQNAGISLIDQAKVQNLIYFSEQDKQRQKQSADVDQLANTIAGQPPQQQAPPPAGPQQQEASPLPPADASTGTERMDMGVQEGEVDQGNVQMGDGTGVHRSGSTGLMGDAKQT